MVTDLLSGLSGVRVKRHGVPKEYAATGSYEERLDYYKLDARGIVEVVRGLLA